MYGNILEAKGDYQMTTELITKEQMEKDKEVLAKIEAALPNITITANGIQIRNEEDINGARMLTAQWQGSIDFAELILRKGIKEAFQTHKTLTTTLKTLQDPYKAGIAIINDEKITPYYDEIELQEKKKAEDAALEETNQRNLRTQAAKSVIDELMQGITDTTTQIDTLTVKLHSEELSDEEAALCRSMIEALQSDQSNAADAAQKAVEQTQQETIPDPGTVATKAQTAKGIGDKKYKCTGVQNARTLLQAILDNKVPIGIVKFDMVFISQLKNKGTDIPTATFSTSRAFRKVKS